MEQTVSQSVLPCQVYLAKVLISDGASCMEGGWWLSLSGSPAHAHVFFIWLFLGHGCLLQGA